MHISKTMLTSAISMIVFGAAASQASTITYSVDQVVGPGSVIGTITTDGVTGTLNASDVVGWDLVLNSYGGTIELTEDNSKEAFGGSGLTADVNNLYFNFSARPGAYFGFQLDGYILSGKEYYCVASYSGPCIQGLNDVTNSYYTAAQAHGEIVAESGTQIIGTVALVPVTVSSVPTPESLPLFGVGLAGLVGLGAARHRRAV